MSQTWQRYGENWLTMFNNQPTETLPAYSDQGTKDDRLNALNVMMARLLAREVGEWAARITTRVHQVVFYEWYLKEVVIREKE